MSSVSGHTVSRYAKYIVGAVMKLHYYPETDFLCVDFNARPRTDSQEIADGIVVDFDADGNVVGLDLDHTSRKLDLASLETIALPMTTVRMA